MLGACEPCDQCGCLRPLVLIDRRTRRRTILSDDVEDVTREGASMSRLILASNSPRRRQLLSEAGYEFKVVIPPWPEPSCAALRLGPADFAEAASYYKAKAVASLCSCGVILAADTVVARGGTIFGKPVDREDARAILSSLAGTRHEVITGVSILDAQTGRRLIAHDRTWVHMRPMSEPDLVTYLDSGLWRGKAGAYGIQDCTDQFIERIEGSFTNVVGLPMELLGQLLGRFGITPTAERSSA